MPIVITVSWVAITVASILYYCVIGGALRMMQNLYITSVRYYNKLANLHSCYGVNYFKGITHYSGQPLHNHRPAVTIQFTPTVAKRN